jgi:hypothetical protein
VTLKQQKGRTAMTRHLTAFLLVFAATLSATPSFAVEDIADTPHFTTTRHAYERGEEAVFTVRAPQATGMMYDVSGWLKTEVGVEKYIASYVVDTDLLREGDYVVRARLLQDGEPSGTLEFPITIGPRHDKERIPVWRWGGGGRNPEWWVKRGFTGGFLASRRDPLREDQDISDILQLLDGATRYDFDLGLYLHPLLATRWKDDDSVICRKSDGTLYKERYRKPYPLEPKIVEHAKATADTWLARLAEYPSLRHVLLHSEWQTPYCVNEPALTMAREEIEIDLREMLGETGYPKPPSTPENGIIPDDWPHYRFMQWWWQRGHGTAVLNAILHDIVKERRPDLITWHDPYRLAPVRNSHKGIDCIATWTYGYPDIKRLCYTTYLQAAARTHDQLVQQDITLYVYGRFAVPLDESTADLSSDFPGRDPFFTAGPDYAKEAIWLVLSQRPDILCFYSAGALSPDKSSLDPYISSPETFDAIGQTADVLIEPYGPAIRACERIEPRVAVLMSAAAAWYDATSPRLPGYDNEQTLPFATLLMMNHVPFDVVLDDGIREGALARYDMLVMPQPDTLTESMYKNIAAFASSGKTVIATPALRAPIPEAKIVNFDFTHQKRINGNDLAKGQAVTAEEDREIMEQYARELAPLLDTIPRPARTNSPRALTNSLTGNGVSYHFLINDNRTYGTRFGKWKLRFEAGAPVEFKADIAVEDGTVLYDALRRRRIDYVSENGRAWFDIRLPGAWGALIVSVPEPIGMVKVEAPESAKPGEHIDVGFAVIGESGDVIPGTLPVLVEFVDPLGRKSAESRYMKTEAGGGTASFVPALNDAEGVWTVRVTDLLAGTVMEHVIVVES